MTVCSSHVQVSLDGAKGAKGPAECVDDGFYEDFIMDEVDLSIENYEELFGAAVNSPEQFLDNDGIDRLFGTNEMSSSDCQGAYPVGVLSGFFYLVLCGYLPLTRLVNLKNG